MINVNSHSLGIDGVDQSTGRKVNTILIRRNTALPAKVTRNFVTFTANQKSVNILVLEGESENPRECSVVGRAIVHNLPKNLPKNWPVEVTYEYQTNGRLSVLAAVPGAKHGVELELQRVSGLSPDSIARWRMVFTKDRIELDAVC